MRIGLAAIPHPLEVRGPGQAKTPLHLRLIYSRVCGKRLWTRRLASCVAALLPADPLDVRIAADSQAMATAQTATPEHLTAISGGHTLSKTVYPDAPADLRLISTFGCHFTSYKDKSKTLIGAILPWFSGTGRNYTVVYAIGQTIRFLHYLPRD